MGGPKAILEQPFYIGINDNFGDSKTHAKFSPVVFNIFDRWTRAYGRRPLKRRGPISTGATGVRFRPALTERGNSGDPGGARVVLAARRTSASVTAQSSSISGSR